MRNKYYIKIYIYLIYIWVLLAAKVETHKSRTNEPWSVNIWGERKAADSTTNRPGKISLRMAGVCTKCKFIFLLLPHS